MTSASNYNGSEGKAQGVRTSIARLKKMQEWRRDNAPRPMLQPMPCTPKQFGEDVDRLIRFAEMAEEIEWLKEIAIDNTYAAIQAAQGLSSYNADRVMTIHLAEIKRIKKIGEMK